MKLISKIPIFLILLIFILSCAAIKRNIPHKYTIGKNFIECNKEIGLVTFDEVVIVSFHPEGWPKEYRVKNRVNGSNINKEIKGEKKVFFDQPTENFEWWRMEKGEYKTYKEPPFKMLPNNWYTISGLVGRWGDPNKYIFIHIDDKGKYTYSFPTLTGNNGPKNLGPAQKKAF